MHSKTKFRRTLALISNSLTKLLRCGRFKGMIVSCLNCGARNQIPDGANPDTYRCGNCHRPTLHEIQYGNPSSHSFGTSAVSGAIGAGIGGLFLGPGGAILGGALGAIIGGATGKQGPDKPKQGDQ